MQSREPATGRHQPATARSAIRILLVDDDEEWVESTAQVLEHQRDAFTVTTATGVAAAEDAVVDIDPDCLVCDYDLGAHTGLDLLETIRSEDDRPFILVTGQGSEAIASEAIGQQATDYIPKRSLSGRTDLLARRIKQAVESYRTERALARERRSKDAMLDILTATSSRDELMQNFCEHLRREHGYACVWIGTTRQSATPTPQAVAGADAYLEAAIEPGDADGATEPAFRATADGETRTVSKIEPDHERADWATAAAECGFESAAATPIRHDDEQFGVLAVYESTPGVESRETTLLEEYADTIGYALRSTDWKESLLSATPVTVEFEVSDETTPLLAVDGQLPPDAQITVLTTVLRAETLLYVLRVEGTTATMFRERIAGLDPVRELRISDDGTPFRIELAVPTPTPETVLAEHGGRIVSETVADGTASITAVNRDGTSLQSLRAALEEACPDLSVRSVRTRTTRPTGNWTTDPFQSLTEKQRNALAVAYFSGYFERPRANDTQEVAEKLGVSRQTFTQHLRAAERKLFEELFDRTDSEQ